MTEVLSHDLLFPDEAFDPIEHIEEDTDTPFLSGTTTMSKKIRLAHQEVTGDQHEHLSAEQEWQLAQQIQAGKEAAAELTHEQTDPVRRAELLEVQEAAFTAREKLMAANLPFAAYYARLSMGLTDTPGADNLDAIARQQKRPRTRDFHLGDITKFSCSNGELDDRIQVAALAMWQATEKFEGRFDRDGHPKPVKFTTLAAYTMYRALSDHCIDEDNKGWSTSRGVFESVLDDEKRLAEGIDRRSRHQGDGGGRHDGYHPSVVRNGRNTQPIDEISFLVPEETDSFGDPQRVGLEEVVAASDSVEEMTQRRIFAAAVKDVLDTLDEREAMIVTRRLGLDGDEPLSLDAIGKELGVSGVRIQQINSRAISKLRHPSRSEIIRGAELEGSTFVGHRELGKLCIGAAHIKTEPVLVPGVLPKTPEQQKVEVSFPAEWPLASATYQEQAIEPPKRTKPEIITVSDEWDAPVRTRLSPRQLERVTQKVFASEFALVMYQNRGVFAADSDPRRIEALAQEIAKWDRLHTKPATKIAYAWNHKFESTVKDITFGLTGQGRIASLDKIVALFSSLLLETSTVEDEVDLYIPERFDGRLNGIGQGFKAGTLRIHGNVGDYAAKNAGAASALCAIEIDGNAGDWCGESVGGLASLTIRGNAGDYFGAGIRSNNVVLHVMGDTGKATGDSSTSGEIIIDGNAKSVSLARGSKMSIRAGRIERIVQR